MGLEELLGLFADRLATGVVLTGPELEPPGPTIRYLNDAFLDMSGYGRDELLGQSPRLLQGSETNPLLRRELGRSLRSGKPFHCILTNYRKSGEAYLCEIIAMPLRSDNGEIHAFIAFEREVLRRPGRPGRGPAGRYRPRDPRTARELTHVFESETGNQSLVNFSAPAPKGGL